MSHCNNGLNNHLVNNLIETKVAKETGDLKYLQDSMREFIAALSDLITGKYSDHFLEEYVNNLFVDYKSTLEESLKIPQLKEEVTLALQRLSAQDKTVRQHTTQLSQLFGDVIKLGNSNIVLESVADLSTIKNPVDGMRVYVKSYHAGLGKGGGYFTYNSTKVAINDYGSVINGWVKEINGKFASIDDFGGDFEKAGSWIKQDITRYCVLSAGEKYTLQDVNEIYFNRFLCRNGKATVVVPAKTYLNYLAKTDGSEIIHLENIDFIILGKRLGEADGKDGLGIYKVVSNTVKTSYINNINVYALTNADDPDSWLDDTGKTRAMPFIRIKVTETSVLKNSKSYGLFLFYIVSAGDAKASHYESNVHAYNAETTIYIPTNKPDADFYEGESKNISLTNTPTQKLYWIGKAIGVVENGKDALMCEAQHSYKYVVDSVYAKNAAERACYIQSSNLFMSNIFDDTCDTASNVKGGGGGVVNIKGVGVSNSTGRTGISYYGFDKLVGADYKIEYSVYNYNLGLVLTKLGDVALSDGYFKNSGVPFYLVGSDNINSLTINNFILENVYDESNASNVFTRRYDSTANLNKLKINNVQHSIDSNVSLSLIGNYAFALKNVTKAEITNSNFVSKLMPFSKENCTNLHINNCTFDIISDTGIDGAVGRINYDNVSANTFDFKVNINKTSDSLPYRAYLHFKKQSDDGMVKCFDYWRSISFEVPITPSGKEVKTLATLIGASFELNVICGTSKLKAVFDASTNGLTETYSLGDLLSTTDTNDTRIRVFMQSGELRVQVLSGYAGTNQKIVISCKRD